MSRVNECKKFGVGIKFFFLFAVAGCVCVGFQKQISLIIYTPAEEPQASSNGSCPSTK